MDKIEKIKKIVDSLDLKNTPLMKRPTDKEISSNVYTNAFKLDDLAVMVEYGKNMHTHDIGNVYHDEETWRYPKGVEEKVEDNKLYKIWYTYRDAADPMDSSCSYCVYYIEEVNETRKELVNYCKHLIKQLS